MRERWKRSWQSLFDENDLVRNNRQTLRVVVSAEQDGAFAVVDVDTLWRNRKTPDLSRWQGRACEVYTKVDEAWRFIFQTGLLNYRRPG